MDDTYAGDAAGQMAPFAQQAHLSACASSLRCNNGFQPRILILTLPLRRGPALCCATLTAHINGAHCWLCITRLPSNASLFLRSCDRLVATYLARFMPQRYQHPVVAQATT